ncbi:extracellular solute-binding protein [Bradyrhizobium cajani]|uniref:Extracellular solute-binding protein n=1 Tax=Bradyrhizobium cajani TaxID=1928661 RepID=A0A844TBI5_9BRAD|nr:extracellular solute-binding protein [Bradyrhizobium cajani]MVT71980.1 extracellular solute-binding protein [Bradyrhizobium cajani]
MPPAREVKRERRRWRVRRVLSYVAAAVIACVVASTARGEDDAALVAAAKAEGKLTFYTSFLGAPFHLVAIKSFEKKYGIPVEMLDVRASELRERLRTEQAAGRFIGDVIQNGAATMIRSQRDGELQPHGGIANTSRLSPRQAATDVVVPSYILAYGILVNTTQVKPADEPKSWKDLLDPRWKGKIQSDDMRALGGGQVMFSVLQDAFGRDYHEKLAAQQPIFSRDVGNDERRVARGEFPMRIPQLFSNTTVLKGLPVKLIIPQEGVPYIRFDMALLRNAPHPNAARLFINHYLSDEVQLIYANAGLIPVVDQLEGPVKEEMRALSGAKLLGTTDVDTQDAMLALAKEIYK